jgi:hypothetical protein
MLDRKAKLTVLAFLLLMLASAIWLVGYTGRWSAIPFFLPACVTFVVAVWQWRLARAEGDLSAWTRWGGFLAISYAAICAGFQLMLVMKVLKLTALPPSSFARVFIAFFGVQLLVLGNWMAKLPPLRAWRPASLSLDAAGEAAMLRFGGWLLVAYALIVIASALFVPASLIAPLISSMSLASLIVVFIRRRQLHKTWIPR